MSACCNCTLRRMCRKSGQCMEILIKFMIQCTLYRFPDCIIGIGSKNRIHFRDLFLHFILITLRQTTGYDQRLAYACLLLFSHLKDRIDAFFLRISDKTATVDDDDIRLGLIIDKCNSVAGQHSDHIFRIDKVLVAAQ